jgi:uncharacterized protein YdaU (DUF1376 family)
MSALPDPPVPADLDLSKLDGFMLDTVRLLGSELVAISTGEEFKAAVLLWCWAWKQRPACSLPDDDRVLASYARQTLPKWKKLKEVALRGFVKCSDGRLYHLVLAQDGLRAARAHERFAADRDADRERLKKWRQRKREKREQGDDETDDETEVKPVSYGVSEHERNANETSKTGRDNTIQKIKYVWEGTVGRLSASDYDRWREGCRNLSEHEFRRELMKADAYYATNPPKDGKWFYPFSRWLAKADAEAVEAKKAASINESW